MISFRDAFGAFSVDALNDAGVATKIYDDPALGTDDPALGADDRGISRRGPDIAGFRDPAGNILSVVVTD